jgi:acyl-CoA synthetase (AMP-forming)/AMP-acid ligase II
MLFQSPWPPLGLPVCSICVAVLKEARQLGTKPAVIEGETGRTLRYEQLSDGADRVAASLSRAGLRPRQPVAIVLPNSIDFVVAWYGALRAGAWVVPINPLYTPPEIEHQIRDSGARLLITVPDRGTALAGTVDRVFVIEESHNELLECQDPPPDVSPAADDLAVLPYSSGTTGKPKGVMLTHAHIVTNMRQLYAAGEYRREDVIVNMMPLYHVGGLIYILNSLLGIGATVVLMRRFDLERWLELNQRYRATILAVPPPVVLAITKSPLWDRFQLDSVQVAISGAAPLGADLQEAFEKRTGLVIKQVWGMTEATCGIAVDSSDRAIRKLGSCGRLLPGSEARVVDVVSQTELGVGETGEIWLRGPQIMNGYWNQPAANAETLMADGWMRTGDLGYFESGGHIFLVDRLKELIKYNALQVAPAELEDIIQSHPAVSDAAVVGAPDEAAGEIPMAFVVRRENATLDAAELMQYVADLVAPHKKIRAVEFIDHIPKSPTGKILRRVLRDRAQTLRRIDQVLAGSRPH